MNYPIGEYEISQINSVLPELEYLYPLEVAQRVRALLTQALKCKFLDESSIYELLTLLPLIIPQHSLSEVKSGDNEDDDFDWPEWNQTESLHRKRTLKQLQQSLAHLLFMQEGVHKMVSQQAKNQKNMLKKQIIR